ncbi:YciI family protein [Roseibium sediminicola]|uniref:YciI family protein n=1 Tax=Roseibium sediminicola TaxID=2933272 RepID=A0ABT0H1I1_9HYPH|nr:YciI family protein [Roseibium sp. CAU 1639]
MADALPPDEHEALLKKHRALQARLERDKTYRGSVQLMPPSTASHIDGSGADPLIIDGPFAETKEQFLGFYLIESDSFEYVTEAAKDLPQGISHIEIRAVNWSSGF